MRVRTGRETAAGGVEVGDARGLAVVIGGLLALGLVGVVGSGSSPEARAQTGTAEPQPMIVGGEVDETPGVGWVAALHERGRYVCSGSLVAPRFVLTAAHCTEGSKPRRWTVRLDSKDRASGGQARGVRRILTFPRYKSHRVWGDMALLRLRRAVAIEPVGLVARGARDVGQTAYIAGWGVTSPRNYGVPRMLHSASIPIRPNLPCRKRFRRYYRPRVMICAGERRPSTCMGDSGGPLARQVDGTWRLLGVTSFGNGRCTHAGGFAWVGSKPLRRWLRTRLGR